MVIQGKPTQKQGSKAAGLICKMTECQLSHITGRSDICHGLFMLLWIASDQKNPVEVS